MSNVNTTAACLFNRYIPEVIECLILIEYVKAGTLIVAGLGMAAVGFGARFMLRTIPNLGQKMANAATSMPRLDGEMFASSKYYKGGFEPKMTKREASLILGVSPTAPPAKVK
ncbi:hypothetical protein HAZT_HAZT011025, partial [Hyalella azteca]